MRKYFIVFCLMVSANHYFSAAEAQEPTLFYTIQLGAFDNPRQSDFEAIRSYAYVYERSGIMFMGGFNTSEAAEAVLEKVKAKGYHDAFIVERKLAESKKAYVVQLATHAAGEPIEWETYSKAGDLWVMPFDKQVRIVQGVYADINDARVKANTLKTQGFPNAFVKTVREITINAVSDFDMSKGTVAIVTPKGPKQATEVHLVRPIANQFSTVTTHPAVKRKAGMQLQTALKEIGMYAGAVDGKVGKGTEEAYAKALRTNRRLKRYQAEAAKIPGFDGWEDARLLQTIARDMNTKDETHEISADLMNNLPESPLVAADAKTVTEWNTTMLKGLDAWSAKSQYNDQIASAFKVAYFKAQIKFADYYIGKGMTEDQANGLSYLIIKTLLADDLEGYY